MEYIDDQAEEGEEENTLPQEAIELPDLPPNTTKERLYNSRILGPLLKRLDEEENLTAMQMLDKELEAIEMEHQQNIVTTEYNNQPGIYTVIICVIMK